MSRPHSVRGEKLPDLAQGLGRGIFEFREATKDFTDALDKDARDAGESIPLRCAKSVRPS